ncbi:MAG: hypothetical protein Kow00107_03100 [Planctomycetota bacterium]
MAKLKKRLSQEFDVEGDMTPLIDCIFLLLIFLMCVTEITKTENDQNLILPYAKMAVEDKEPEKRVVINVWPKEQRLQKMWENQKPVPADAVVTISGQPMSWGEVQQHLELIAKTADKTPGGAATGGRELVDMPVKIRGHRTTPFKYVQFAMVYCIDMAYWKISFGTYNKDDFKLPAPIFEEGVGKGWEPSDLSRIFQ